MYKKPGLDGSLTYLETIYEEVEGITTKAV